MNCNCKAEKEMLEFRFTLLLRIRWCSNMLALLGSEKSCDLKQCFKVRELCRGLPRAAITILLQN